MHSSDNLGVKMHIPVTKDGCAVGWMLAKDIIVSRRVFDGEMPGYMKGFGVWRASAHARVHRADRCPNGD